MRGVYLFFVLLLLAALASGCVSGQLRDAAVRLQPGFRRIMEDCVPRLGLGSDEQDAAHRMAHQRARSPGCPYCDLEGAVEAHDAALGELGSLAREGS